MTRYISEESIRTAGTSVLNSLQNSVCASARLIFNLHGFITKSFTIDTQKPV